MNKQESKYFYTASLMDEALLLLLGEKDFERITVKELCEKAGVNRATFYLHYENLNDLLDETISLINKRFTDSFASVEIADPREEVLTTEKFLRPYLTLIKENKRAYTVVRRKENLFNTRKAFAALYQSIFSPALSAFGVDEKDKKYTFAFYLQGTIAIIGEWIDGNCEDDVDMIIDLIMKHTRAYENNR